MQTAFYSRSSSISPSSSSRRSILGEGNLRYFLCQSLTFLFLAAPRLFSQLDERLATVRSSYDRRAQCVQWPLRRTQTKPTVNGCCCCCWNATSESERESLVGFRVQHDGEERIRRATTTRAIRRILHATVFSHFHPRDRLA